MSIAKIHRTELSAPSMMEGRIFTPSSRNDCITETADFELIQPGSQSLM